MNFPANFYYLSVGVAVWIAVAALVFVAIEIIRTLKATQTILTDVKKSVADLELLKTSIKVGVMTLVSNLLGKKNQLKGGASKDND